MAAIQPSRGSQRARTTLRILSVLLLALHSGGRAEETAPPVPVTFSDFSARIQLVGSRPGLDKLEAIGRFELGAGSNGADPEREEVVFSLGPFTRRLPPGSFRARTAGGLTFWEYRERQGGEIVIRRQGTVWTFRADFRRLEIAELANPLAFVLRIGDDEGRRAHYYGRRRAGVVEFWDYPPFLDGDADDDGVSREAGDCDDQNPRVHPGAAEVCDGLDNDCDLQSDEGFDLGSVCTAGVGACSRTGLTICSGSAAGTVCDATLGSPSPELCNGIDDDCDGAPDEDLGTLTCGSGRCATTVPACVNGVPQVCTAMDPAPEICGNGVDEDCDGSDLACPDMAIAFAEPASLATFRQTPIEVAGTVTGGAVEMTCAGVPAGLSGDAFSAQVPLREGRNLITCTARDAAGLAATGSVRVTLDTTPPSLVIETPRDGLLTAASAVTVMGTFNDLIGDALDATAVSVTCNGRPAAVENRSFMLHDLPLRPGPNAIRCTATDLAGNSGESAEIRVVRQEVAGQRIERVAGDDQSAPVGTELPQPLVVRLADATGIPVAGRTVTFQVTRGSGVLTDGSSESRRLSVATDASGQAAVRFRLGSRAGAGDHRVRATALGFVGEVELMATANTGTPDRILAVGGEIQRAAVGALLPLPLLVLVVDAQGNPVPGIPVTFEVVQGGGDLDGQTSVTVETGATGRATAAWKLGPVEGVNNNLAIATFPDLAGLPATFVASGLLPGRLEDTSFSGVVLDNANLPIPGVTVEIPGTALQTTTDDQGRFTLRGVPVGTFHLHLDGGTSPRPETFSGLAFEATTIAGRDNTVGMPILIPALDTASARLCGGPTACVLSMANVPGMTITIHPNSATFHGGATQGEVMLTQVHLDKVPMTPPDGGLLIPAWTLQPHGVHFDPPASVTIPNTAGLAPGERAEFFQFDHDLNEFVNIGMGTVSEDGAVVVSDPGYGIPSAGWGGFRPPPPPTTAVQGPAPPLPNAVNPVSGSTGALATGTRRAGDGRFGAFRSNSGVQTNHHGIDIVASTGTVVNAAESGTVVRVTFDPADAPVGTPPENITALAGNQVIVDHGNGIFTRYMHLSGPPPVQAGDPVVGGMTPIGQVGVSGNAGNTDQPHLHFEVRGNNPYTGVALDPTGIVQQPPRQTTSPPLGGGGIGSPSFLLPLKELEPADEDTGDATATGPGPLSDVVCTLTILSRNLPMIPGLGFFLFDVPATLSSIRARATCTGPDGTLLGGSSPFFAPRPSGTVFVDAIPLAAIEPLPVSARLGAGRTLLSAVGETAQLTLTGSLPDGSTIDLTPATSGTVYRTSRSEVATVSADGLVTALASGSAMITALHEGIVATLTFTVQTGDDGDGDGLPDEYEARNPCLSSSLPDAAADPDGDGRTNLQELQTGTDPCFADTDGDGLSDGQEAAIGSHPVLPDSDLDGLLDGQEPNPTGNGDGDGLINVLDPDQDDDGLRDGIEVRICGNPTCANPNSDNDGDGLSNLDEVQLGTDPTRADTDGDGLTDSAEVLGGTDPLSFDMDGDGFPDGYEVGLGSDPKDPASRPSPPPVTEAMGRVFSVLDTALPPAPAAAEATGWTFSLLNQAGPQPPALLESVSRLFSVQNTTSP